LVARLEPLLEAHDRLVAAGDVRGALEPVELLHGLDRVALERRAQRLLDDPVDEPFEDLALAVAVLPPQRLVDDLARLVAIAVAEQVLEPAGRLVERMALEVEPHVALVGLRHQPEAAFGLVLEELPEIRPGAAAAELERRL